MRRRKMQSRLFSMIEPATGTRTLKENSTHGTGSTATGTGSTCDGMDILGVCVPI